MTRTRDASRSAPRPSRAAATEDQAASSILGERVLALRKRRRLSADSLAKRAKIGSRPHLTHLELGRIDPRLGTVRRLAAALGVLISDLVDDAPSRSAVVARVRALPSAALPDLVRVLSIIERAHALGASPNDADASGRTLVRRSRRRAGA